MRLYGTQAFKNVTRTIEQNEDNPDTYDVTINLEEQRSGTISIGGGIDTVTGLFGTAGGVTDVVSTVKSFVKSYNSLLDSFNECFITEDIKYISGFDIFS